MANTTIGTVSGVFLRPGTSRNGRRYTKANIADAVARMKRRLAAGGMPVTMNASHAATMSGDVTKTAAYVKRVWQEDDGAARFTARLVDTRAGRDIAALATPDEDGRAALRGVSIFGRWVGEVSREGGAESAPGLEVTGIDFTHYPGIDGAVLDRVRLAEMAGAGYFAESATGGIFVDAPTPTFSPRQRRALAEMGISDVEAFVREGRGVVGERAEVVAEMSDGELWGAYAAGVTPGGSRPAPGTPAATREALEAALRLRPDLLAEAERMVARQGLVAEALVEHGAPSEKELSEMSDDELWASYSGAQRP